MAIPPGWRRASTRSTGLPATSATTTPIRPAFLPTPTRPSVTQDEYITVPGSLLGKAKVAQTVFDTKFLLPFAPERPEFFLVPGNQQVTILWARSATETMPDPFFAIASLATAERRTERAVRSQLPRHRR